MQELILNPDILGLKESATLKINQTVKDERAKGNEMFHFGFGQSPFPVHSRIVDKLKEHAHEKDYLPTQGLPALRDTIAKYYTDNMNYKVSGEDIIIGPGSKELIFQALYTLQGTVLIPAPSWVSYGPQVNIRGNHITRVMTTRENDYKLKAADLDRVCETLMDSQKLLIINSPNNPTGSVYNEDDIKEIVEICRKHNVIIISDEIYGLIDWTGETKKGFFHYYPERTIISGGLSKAFSAGGYRLGYLVVPREMKALTKAIVSLISETFSSVCAPVSYAAIEAFQGHKDVDEYVLNCKKIHEAVGGYIHDRMTKMGILLPNPQGAFYLFPDFQNHRQKLVDKFGVKTSDDLANILLKEARCAFLPGSDFYFSADRLCLRGSTVDYDGELVYQAAEKVSFKIDGGFVDKNCASIKAGLDHLEKFINSL